MAKESSLRVALEQDHHNFGVSEESLGATALLVDDLLDLYDSLGKIVWDTKLKPTDDVALALPLMMKCRLCLVRAATLAMQGHFPECATQTRTAIESCATAKKFHRDFSSAKVWLQAELDDRKKVRQEFSTRELFPKEDQRLGRLRGQYDTNSVLTHISTHSLAQNVKAVREKGGLQLYLSSSGLAFSGVPGMLTYFMNIIDSQCAILDLFGEIFLSAKTGAGDAWLAQSRQIFERVGRHVRKAGPTISAWVRSLREQTDS